MNLKVIKVSGKEDANGMTGAVLVGGSKVINKGLGNQVVDEVFYAKIGSEYQVDHVFEDVDLANFHQEQGDNIIFLTPKE